MGSSEGPGDKTLEERDRGHFPHETWCKLLWPFYAGLVVLIPWILSVCSIILAVQWRGFPHTGTISQRDCLISMVMDVFMSMCDKFFYWFALPSRNIFFVVSVYCLVLPDTHFPQNEKHFPSNLVLFSSTFSIYFSGVMILLQRTWKNFLYDLLQSQ